MTSGVLKLKTQIGHVKHDGKVYSIMVHGRSLRLTLVKSAAKLKIHNHNTVNRYNQGCRCIRCTEAAAAYHRLWKKKKLRGGGVKIRKYAKHGTYDCYTLGCRCKRCRKAAHVRYMHKQEYVCNYMREWRKKRFNNGICKECPSKRARGHVCCMKCLKKRRRR
jgi:hypothetical protein